MVCLSRIANGSGLRLAGTETQIQRRHQVEIEQGRRDEAAQDDDSHRILDFVPWQAWGP